jgi:hypothetical protein
MILESVIQDWEAMETLARAFREDEAYLNGFETVKCLRHPSSIDWEFTKEVTEKTEFFFAELFVPDDAGMVEGVRFYFAHMNCLPYDLVRITYTLSWYYYGGGDDDPTISHNPFPGCSIRFELSTAA